MRRRGFEREDEERREENGGVMRGESDEWSLMGLAFYFNFEFLFFLVLGIGVGRERVGKVPRVTTITPSGLSCRC